MGTISQEGPELSRQDEQSWGQRWSDETSANDAAEALNAAFRKMVADGEELLRATANYSAEGWAAARDRFQSNLEQAKVRVNQAQSVLKNKAGDATTATQAYVNENPWKSVAIVGTIGLLLGYILGRRS